MRKLAILVTIVFFSSRAAAQVPVSELRDRLEHHMYTLASDSLEGRGAGTPGGHKAAMYVAEQFRLIGLEPLNVTTSDNSGSDSSYLVGFGKVRGGDVYNVVGMIRGSDPELRYEAIVIGAHFDHLGIKKKDSANPVIYNGADDNASGTATLIEVARMMKEREGELKRTVVFAAFDAEELGLHGSKAFVKTMLDSEGFPKPALMVSMDMVGWLEAGGNLRIKGVAMLKNGRKIMESLDTPEGLRIKLKNFDNMMMGGSDHDSFAEKGIPAFYMSTGMKSPYHKPEDTAEKIDYDGMALITEYMAGFTEEFATRDMVRSSGRASSKHKGRRLFEVGLIASLDGNKHHYRDGALTGKSAFAWSAGLTAQFNVSRFAIRPAVLYESRGAMWPDAAGADIFYDTKKFLSQGITVPLDLIIKTSNQDPFYGYAFAGGYYSRLIDGTFPEGYKLGEGVRRDEFGWQWGIGLSVYSLSMEFKWKYALTPVLEKTYSPDIRNRGFQFSVGYRF